jgi:hypothetical protein
LAAVGVALLALGAALAACTSDQDPAKTPMGSVLTGNTDSASGYFDKVQQANQEHQQSGQPGAP